ncbi:MAG: helix-hairpin-helix domain-containing protein [Mariniphaga sp.]
MSVKRTLLLISLILISALCSAQVNEEQNEVEIEKVIESMAESDESDIANSVILDDLTRNAEHQLNINLATSEDLEQLNILDFNQIQNLLAYRKRNGYLISPYEFAAIEGFTPDLIQKITPFILFEVPQDSVSLSRKKVYQKVMLRVKSSFPQAQGYQATSETKGAAYPGLPVSLYGRYQIEIPGKFEFGLITDHDAGEELFKGSNRYGLDYYSAFISYKSSSFIRQVTVGDFLLRFGQGVSFWTGSGMGKSGDGIGIMKSGQGARPYTSTDENRFFRGISTTLGSGPFRLTLFYSDKNRDANITTDAQTGVSYFTSLQTSGYHRTASEVEDEKRVNEQLTGGYTELRFRKFKVGALFVEQKFNYLMEAGTSPYKAKSFLGNENYNIGIDYQLALRRIQLFGEGGISQSGKPGVVQGLVWHAHPQVCWAFYFRHFDAGFHTFYGSSLSESSGNRNETGLYTGLLLYPIPKVKITGFVDLYYFPWLTYSTMSPGSGSDYLVQIDLALSRKFSGYFKAKYETKPQKVSVSTGVASDADEMTTKLRLHTQWNVNEKVTLRSRIEYAGYSFNGINENGFLAFQDFLLKPSRKITIWLRYAWFKTDGYNSRIYTYENDLLYSFSIPEFHGSGHRIYLNLKWRPTSRITAYLKGGLTLHNGATSWGSANDLTLGNSRSEVKALLYFKF